MNIPKINLIYIFGSVIAASALLYSKAQADGHYFPPIKDPVVLEECGSCHLAFPAALLPARSWDRMMNELDNHFGDDASLTPELNQHVRQYLMQNAAESNRRGTKWIRDLADNASPQRITELPKWKREHRKVKDWEWQQADVKTKSNCAACHDDAERGYFDD
ncbi:MAG: hypothetical protein RL217_552 [Pseudomonadota bacterium]|jgi:hypothetical protein